ELLSQYLAAVPRGPFSPRARAHLERLMAAPVHSAAPPELSQCLEGKVPPGQRVLAEVKLVGRGAAPEVHVFPPDADPEIAKCLAAAAARLSAPSTYELSAGAK